MIRTHEKKLSSKPRCQSSFVTFCSRVGVPPPPSVVHEDVDAPELVQRAFDDQRRGVGVEQVGDDPDDAHTVRLAFVRGLLQRRRVPGVQHDVGALAGEVERDLPSDAATRAGDDRDAVAQPELHHPSAATRSAYAMGSSSMS